MKRVLFLWEYFVYRIKAKNEHSIHSPFVFELYNNTICDVTPYYIYDSIESLRAKLLLSDIEITVEDHGAGSTIQNSTHRKVSAIAKNSLKPPKYAQLLFRLVNRFKPATILELGTSFGLSTGYMASANKRCQVTTVEACPNIAKVARVNFNKLNIKNIDLVNDRFDNFLPEYLEKTKSLDFVFFDGNHQKKATMNYFYLCLERVNKDTIFIFDDIYWSAGMKSAWEEVKKNPRVRITVDLFFFGIVFFNNDLSKEDFILRF